MTTIRKNPTTKFGYEMVKDGEIMPITSKTTDGYLKLPEIVNGRKLISLKEIECNMVDGEYQIDHLTQRAPKSSTNTSPKSSNNSWQEFICEEDKEIFFQIMERAKKRQARAKLEAEIEAQKKLLNEMMAKLEVEAE